jgi:hypothetical protein
VNESLEISVEEIKWKSELAVIVYVYEYNMF